jgi:galactokinase/mevalonate kinase-like predicted kinase
VNPLRVKEWVRNELETSTVLFYTALLHKTCLQLVGSRHE